MSTIGFKNTAAMPAYPNSIDIIMFKQVRETVYPPTFDTISNYTPPAERCKKVLKKIGKVGRRFIAKA
jgi:hypothetical protein